MICFPFHNWGKWEEVGHGYEFWFFLPSGEYMKAKRKCDDCGLIRFKKIRSV
jgi:hypothetical protein